MGEREPLIPFRIEQRRTSGGHRLLRLTGEPPFITLVASEIEKSGAGVAWGAGRPGSALREVKPTGVKPDVLRSWILAYLDGPYNDAGLPLADYLRNAHHAIRQRRTT
jgi:hypothetical protein